MRHVLHQLHSYSPLSYLKKRKWMYEIIVPSVSGHHSVCKGFEPGDVVPMKDDMNAVPEGNFIAILFDFVQYGG